LFCTGKKKMASSLAKQLKNLSQSDGRSQSGSKKVSLLFSQREAAALDLDDIFDLGTNGLLELAQMDDRFNAHPLFSAQARRTDRESQSQEENRKLDELISQFLVLLSPYFMSRPCHKVLEWLLRRFSIHRFNVLDVMVCCLPYHETVIASRLVQLLVIEKTLFSFFDGVRKTGAPMPRGVLVERCVHSPALLPFVFERVQASVACGVANRALTSLWASLCVGVVRLRPNEETVRSVLSLSLSVTKDANLRAANHMAIAQVCASVHLEQEAIDAVIASLSVTDLSLLCLLFQTQPLAQASRSLAFNLLSQPSALLQASAKYDVSVLVAALLRHVLDPEVREGDSLFSAWKGNADKFGSLLSPEMVSSFVSSSLLQCARSAVAPSPDYVRNRLAGVLLSLGSDAGLGVASALSACGSDAELHARVERLSVDVFGAMSCHSPLPGTGTTMLLALSHKDPRVRQAGVTAIDKEIRGKRLDLKHQLVASACLLALDSDVQIAEFVISSSWFSVVASDNVFVYLRTALSLDQRADQRLVRAALPVALAANLELGLAAVLGLCCVKPKVEGNAIVPFVAVLAACQQVSADGGVSHPIITALASLFNDEREGEGRSSKKQKASSDVLKADAEGVSLKNLVNAIANVCKKKFAKCWPLVSVQLHKHVLLLVCQQMLKVDSSNAAVVAGRAVEILLELSQKTVFSLVVAPVEDGDWKAEWATNVAIVAADCVTVLAKQAPLDLGRSVFALICSLDASDESVVAGVFESFLARIEDPALYMCTFQAFHHNDDEKHALVQIRALHVLEAVFQAASKSSNVLPKLSVWVSALVVALQSSNGRIRRAALRCVTRLGKADGRKGSSAFLISFLKAADQKSAEIKNSADAVAFVMQGLALTNSADVLKWAKQALLEKRNSNSVDHSYAVLRSIRLVGDEARIGLLESRLASALSDGNSQEAIVLLEGLAFCAAALGKHEETLALVLKALQSPDDKIVFSALGVIVPSMWAGLEPTSKRQVLSGLCQVLSMHRGELASTAARVAREVGAAKGSEIVAAELHVNLNHGSKGGSKKVKQAPRKEVFLEELARIEVVLELLRASRGGDAVTADALLNLLRELSEIASSTKEGEELASSSMDFTVQLALAVLAPLVDSGIAKLGESGVDALLKCLHANHTPHLRKSVLAVLSSSADHDPMPVARQILTLFRADAKELIAVDNKTSFRIMRGLLEKVLPHLSEDHCDHVLDVFVRSLATIPSHRQLVLLESAARYLPGQPLGQILALVLTTSVLSEIERQSLAAGLCAELGPVSTTRGLKDFVSRAGGTAVTNRFVADTLSSDGFVKSCVGITSTEEAALLQELLGSLFRKLLSNLDEDDDEMVLDDDNSESIYDAIDSINELFTVGYFLSVVKSLLVHANHEVRFRATRVLNERIASHRGQGLSKDEEVAYGSLLPVLERSLADMSEDRLVQATFLSIDILGRSVGAANSQQALSALAAVARLIRGKPRGELFASGLLCISALCSKLGPVVLPFLGDYLQLFLEGLSGSDIAFAALSGIFEIVSSLGAFLGPFCESLLHACLQSVVLQQPNLQRRSRQIADAFAQTLAPRLLAPVLQKLALAEETPAAVKEVVRAAGFASTQTSRPSDLRLLWNVCVSAFESVAAARDTSVIGDAAEAAAEVAFHLSESEFRPLFQALTDAVPATLPTPRKCAPVFCVSSALLRRLKALAVPWVCKLSGTVAHVLSVREEDLFASQAAVVVLDQLFANDVDGAISKEVHTELIDPLVDCLGSDELRDKASVAIVEMAKSMASDALWKPLNYQILLKMRSRDKRVQLVCLKTIQKFWDQFKEDFLLLLPDVLPFLGEVMEEEDEEVVKAAQQLLATINALLPNNITF
jgi:hypothetical protein